MKNLDIYKEINNHYTLQKTNKFKPSVAIVVVIALLNFLSIGDKIGQNYKLNQDIKYIKANMKPIQNGQVEVITINTKNKFFKKTEENELVSSSIENRFDIIGTQETKKSDFKKIENVINENGYSITGEGRFGNGLIGLCFTVSNETNSILSKNEIYMAKTFNLPWIPRINEIKEGIKNGSIMPRIATHCVTNLDEIGYTHIYNTHLDYGVDSIQRRQIENLLNIIDKNYHTISLPTIILGDFNAVKGSPNMQYLIDELRKRNISMVPPKNQEQIDYIFASNEFLVEDVKTIHNTQSDHNAIKANLYVKRK